MSSKRHAELERERALDLAIALPGSEAAVGQERLHGRDSGTVAARLKRSGPVARFAAAARPAAALRRAATRRPRRCSGPPLGRSRADLPPGRSRSTAGARQPPRPAKQDSRRAGRGFPPARAAPRVARAQSPASPPVRPSSSANAAVGPEAHPRPGRAPAPAARGRRGPLGSPPPRARLRPREECSIIAGSVRLLHCTPFASWSVRCSRVPPPRSRTARGVSRSRRSTARRRTSARAGRAHEGSREPSAARTAWRRARARRGPRLHGARVLRVGLQPGAPLAAAQLVERRVARDPEHPRLGAAPPGR